MSVKQVLKLESEALTGQPVTIPFQFSDTSSFPPIFFDKDPTKRKKIPDSIVIRPITVRTWERLKPLLTLIEQDDKDKMIALNDSAFNSEVESLMSKYDSLLFEIVCVGIHNKKGNMPKWFRETLKDNSTWEDVYILLNAILFRLSVNPFSNSITLLKSVSPIAEAEIIALQKNSRTWYSKVGSCSLPSAVRR